MNLKRYILYVLFGTIVITLYSACDSDTGASTEDSEILTLSIFEGGQGSEIWEKTIKMFKEEHPNVEIEIEMSPDNHEQLRLQYLDGNPPDFQYASPRNFDHFHLIQEGELASLEDLMQSESPTSEGDFEEDFMPGVLDGIRSLRDDNELTLLPFLLQVQGQYYNENLFKEKGWEVPRNFNEYNSVAEKMKNEGIAPLVYPGVHPTYLSWSILPLIGSVGGEEALEKINRYEENSWDNPEVREALKRLEEMRDNGHIQNGALGFDHMQAQIEFANGRAGFVASGSWLENELEGSWPDDFELQFLGNPMIEDTEEQYIAIKYALAAVPEKAKNPEMGMEFAKFLFTDEVIELWAEENGSIAPIKNFMEYENMFPQSVISSLEIFEEPDTNVYFQSFTEFNAEISKTMGDGLNGIVEGNMSIEEFVERMEEANRNLRES